MNLAVSYHEAFCGNLNNQSKVTRPVQILAMILEGGGTYRASLWYGVMDDPSKFL